MLGVYFRVLNVNVFYVVVIFIRTTTYIKCISRTLWRLLKDARWKSKENNYLFADGGISDCAFLWWNLFVVWCYWSRRQNRGRGCTVVDANWRVDSSELIAKFRVRKQRSCGRDFLKKKQLYVCLIVLSEPNRTGIVGLEVLTPVTTKITVCWVVTSLVFELLIDVSEEPAVPSTMVDWSRLNLWLWIVTTWQLVAIIFKNVIC
jgi:hypothetical protein